MQNNWTWAELETVRKNFPYKGPETHKLLNDRGLAVTFEKASALHTQLHNEYSAEEKRLARLYGPTIGTALVFFMPHRTVYEVEELLCKNAGT